MPTKKSQGMLGLMRSHKKMISGVGSRWIMSIDPPADIVARLRMNGTRAVSVKDFPLPALMITPGSVKKTDGVILHLHGGAYVSGGILQCRAIISPICAAAGLRAFTFCYHLAPQYAYPTQLKEAYDAYQYLLHQGYAPEKIVFAGESAGGNLALALALKLRDEGKTLPGAIALLSPWVDLEQTGESYTALRETDATLNGEELLAHAISFAGSESMLGDPRISPVKADFHGFPPVLIHCGTREILLSDSEKLEKAMLRDGVAAKLIRWEGMCHVFQAFGFEESKAANRQLGSFLLAMLQ